MKKLWQKFNTWIDPKFGIHVFWMVPYFYTGQIKMQIQEWQHRKHITKILKDNSDINKLSKLAGIRNERRF